MRPVSQRVFWRLLLAAPAAAVFAWMCMCFGGRLDGGQKASAGKNPQTSVTISKATTHITEPLRSDGYVDYFAALNQRASQDVTPENNSAVLFWKAIGPAKIAATHRDEYLKRLGIPPLPEKGEYFVPFDEFVRERKNAEIAPDEPADDANVKDTIYQYDVAHARPWSKDEFPVLAAWLASNEKPLALLTQAAQRPRRYDPLIAEEDGILIGVLLNSAQEQREVARAFSARAMLRLGEAKIDEAWDDLLTCHRMSRLAGQGATLVEALVGTALDGMACAGDQALLQHAHLTQAQIAKMRDELNRLPPMAEMVDKIDIGERFMLLDAVSMIAREGIESLSKLDGGSQTKSTTKSITSLAAKAAIDWDEVLRIGNTWYDRLVDAMRQPTRTERKEAETKIDHDLQTAMANLKDWKSLALSALRNPRKAVSERIGYVFVALLLPAISAVANADDRETMRFELTKLALALAEYNVDHGSYPPTLADLTPKYFAKIPQDIFSVDDLHYTQQGDGYLLYSVGPNGVDDGGKADDDTPQTEGSDDLVVRIPAETGKKAKKPGG